MKLSAVSSLVFRVLVIASIGIGLGLSAWQLMSVAGMNRDIGWIPNLIAPAFPILVLAWLGSVIIFGVLLINPSTRPIGVRWLITTLIIWLVTTFLIVGVYYSFGSAYSPPFIEVAAGGAYVAAGLGFGFMLAPLLIVRTIRAKRFKGMGDDSP